MLKAGSLSVSWVENYMQLILPSVQKTILDIDTKCTNFITKYNDKYVRNHHIEITVPYMKESLTWEMSFNPLYPDLGPDLFLEQHNYFENEDNEYFTAGIENGNLIKWDFTNISSLPQLINELLSYYRNYQLNLLKVHSERWFDEIKFLQSEVPFQNIETMITVGQKQTKLQILVKFQINQSNSNAQQILNGWNSLLFKCGGSALTSVTVELCLSPSIYNFVSDIDLEPIAPFHEKQSLIKYVQQQQNCILDKTATISQMFQKRKQFIISLLVLQYATLLEYDTMSYRKISLNLEYDEIFFVLEFVLSLSFPEVQYSLSLRSIYHMTDQGVPLSKCIKNVPYKSGWEPKKMIAKALQYVFDKEIVGFRNLQR